MAGRIPQNFIDELLARIDIVDVIDARVPLNKRGKEYQALCPFHNEKTPSFTVIPHKQFYHCFGCGAHGTALGFLMDYEHLEFVEAVEALAQDLGLEVPREGSEPRPQSRVDLQLLAQAAEFYKEQLRHSPQAIEYLKRRGLSGKTAAEFGLGFAPAGWDHLVRHLADAGPPVLLQAGLVARNEQGRYYDRFRERIVFPIRDRRGRVIGFGGRVLDDTLPKYLNSPETPLFHKGRVLYGMYEAREAASRHNSLLIVEGYMDVVALAQHGVRNVVATLGTAATHQHMELAFRQVQELVFCFDGDRAGRAAAWRALEQTLPVFRDGLEARFLFLPEGEDPDSLIRREGPQDFLGRVAGAQPLADLLVRQLTAEVDLDTAAGRARLAQTARPYIERLGDGVYKQLLQRRFSELVGVELGGRTTSRQVPPKTRDVGHRSVHTPVRKAIALLLRHPELAREELGMAGLEGLRLPGVALLVEIIETFRSHPHLTSAALIERCRGSEHYPHLLKLMQWEPPQGEGYDDRREFGDVLSKLSRSGIQQRVAELVRQERDRGLGQDERLELQQLLQRDRPH
jgi:DNA primase